MSTSSKKLDLGPVPHPANDRFRRPTPVGVPSLPSLNVLVGKPKQGKSTTCARLVRWYIDHGYLDRDLTFVISSSTHSNKHLWNEALQLPEDNIIGVKSCQEIKTSIEEIIEKVQNIKDEFDMEQFYRDAYGALVTGRKLTPDQVTVLEMNEARPPTCGVSFPKACIILDDLQGFSNVLQKQWFISVMLRYRHLAGGVGITFYVLIQTLRGQGGLSRAVRQSASMFVCYATHDSTAISNLSDECCHLCSKERFQQIFRDATAEPHSYLVVDLTQDKEHVFSSCFEKFYSPDSKIATCLPKPKLIRQRK